MRYRHMLGEGSDYYSHSVYVPLRVGKGWERVSTSANPNMAIRVATKRAGPDGKAVVLRHNTEPPKTVRNPNNIPHGTPGSEIVHRINYPGFSRPMQAHEAKQYKAKDRLGNSYAVEVEKDKDLGDYVASVRAGRYRKMASGNEKQPILAIGTGRTPEDAVKEVQKRLRYESVSGHSVQTLDEVLKKDKNEPSAGDNRAIKSLTDGKYPAKAEDGKGFCFQWADGRGTTAFKWRNDALRWAKAEPRDIVKFWYGEPVHSNGKFRIRVTDRYRKEEEDTSVEVFSDLLERRRVS
jgi:hypothetical protein